MPSKSKACKKKAHKRRPRSRPTTCQESAEEVNAETKDEQPLDTEREDQQMEHLAESFDDALSVQASDSATTGLPSSSRPRVDARRRRDLVSLLMLEDTAQDAWRCLDDMAERLNMVEELAECRAEAAALRGSVPVAALVPRGETRYPYYPTFHRDMAALIFCLSQTKYDEFCPAHLRSSK